MLRTRKSRTQKAPKPRKHGESGQSMVEFALALPLLVLLLAGFCDMGWILLHKIRLENLAYTLSYINQSYDSTAATYNLVTYTKNNYPHYPDPTSGKFTIKADVTWDRIEYNEYIWQPHKQGGVYYRVDMYNFTVFTTVNLEYKVPYLTGFGKFFFGTEDNEFTVTAQASGYRLIENEAH